MDPKHRARILYRLDTLTESTGNLTPLLVSLVSKGVISVTELETIENSITTVGKCESLYLTCTRKGPDAFERLVEALHYSKNEHVALTLESELTGAELRRLDADVKLHGQVWFDIKEAVENFCGRESELAQLDEYRAEQLSLVDRQKVTVVCGLGGVGKTELARKFAYSAYKNMYTHCLWVRGENGGSISASIKRLAEHTLVQAPLLDRAGDERPFSDLVVDIFTVLGQRDSLLIVDNVDEFRGLVEELVDAVTRLAPGLRRPFILFTSRNKKLLAGSNRLLLDVLTTEAAVEFVRTSLHQDGDDGRPPFDAGLALELCKVFQCFPLALNQAVSYISYQNELELELNNRGFGIGDYLRLYQSQTQHLLDYYPEVKNTHSYTKSAFLTWNLTLLKIRENGVVGSVAETVLNISSLLAPDSIRVDFLRGTFLMFMKHWKTMHSSHHTRGEEAQEHFCEWILSWCQVKSAKHDDSESNSISFDNALHLINRYSMFHMRYAEISIHRLVQEVIRISLCTESLQHKYLDTLLGTFDSSDSCGYSGENVLHVRKTWMHATITSLNNGCRPLVKKYPNIPGRIFAVLQAAIRYEEAHSFAAYAVNVLKETLGPDHTASIGMLDHLGDILHKRGEYEKSVDLFSQVIEAKTSLLGPESVDVAETRQERSVALMRAGKYAEALQECEVVHDLKKKTLGSLHPSTLIVLNNKSLILSRQGRSRDALEILLGIYELQREQQGELHPDVLTTRKNIANMLEDLGQVSDAYLIHCAVHEARVHVLGPDHPDTLGSKGSMAGNLFSLGRYEDGFVVLQDVIQRRALMLGPNHHDVLHSKNIHAVMLSKTGRFEESLAIHEETLTKVEGGLGRSHPLHAMILQNMAYTLNGLQRHDEALDILTGLHEAQSLILGVHDKLVLTIRGNIALTLRSMGRYDEALAIYEEVYQARLTKNGEMSPITLLIRHNLGGTLIRMGRREEGLRVLQSVWHARKEVLGEDHPVTQEYFEELQLLHSKSQCDDCP